MKDKNNMIISIDAKIICQNLTSIYDKKKNSQSGTEEKYINIIKAIYDKPTADIFNGEKLKAFFP